MQNILNRDVIIDNIIFDNCTKDKISFAIDKIKNLLRDAGAQKGDLITISILLVNHWHVASIFACAEMGLKIIILDSPATLESLPYTKLALHGPSQFYIHDSDIDTTHIYGGLHDEMIKRYGGQAIDIRDESSSEYFHVEVFPDDPLLLSSTSGTTKPSRPILFSHKEVYEISKRNIDIFDFDENSVVCHSRNLHHASALLTSLLPALMKSRRHFNIPIGHDTSGEDHLLLQGYQGIRNVNTTHIMIPNKATLIDFLETINDPFIETLNINMCGFALDQSFVELAEKYNLRFQSHYGSIDTAIPLLVNHVTKDTEHKENSLGILPDHEYEIEISDTNHVKVYSKQFGWTRDMDDLLKVVDNQYFILGRTNNAVDEIIQRSQELNIDLEPFFQDTKINMEQLRGYLTFFEKKT